MGSNRNPLTRQEVLKAAMACIERYGIAKTSMTDVGKALGVTRQTVHRIFETRAELFAAIAEVRIEKLATRLTAEFQKFDCLEEALVEGSLMSLAAGRSDVILTEIQQGGDHAVDQYMFRGSPKVQELMVALWGPLIDAARAQGRIKPEVSTEAAVAWIRNIHAMLTMRDDYRDNTNRNMLQDFLVPSIMSHNSV